ncbi:calcium-binding protein [Algirhabdus cladophorae]|uniref:calcium-binding protein n=1 Tax=Algirhabdus cladophorae TaxID=3377108 RepID=UPI003B849519
MSVAAKNQSAPMFQVGDVVQSFMVSESDLANIAKAPVMEAPFEGPDQKLARHTVYNFEVAGTHTYIAGGYRVHNTSTLDFYDPDENGMITDVYTDDEGRLVFESISDDGGRWKVYSTTPSGQNTTTVTKEYTLGVFNEATGQIETRFYLQQDNYYELIDGEQVLVDIEIGEIYQLYGDEVGGGVADVLTPFILEAIGAESPLEQLVAGTMINTLIQNIAEGGLNVLHHSILDTPTNGEAVGEMIFGAWEDFGIDLAVNGLETATSLISQVIMAEIFGSLEPDNIGEAFMQALVSEGINNVIEFGVSSLVDSIWGADSAIGQAYNPAAFNFGDIMSYASLFLNLAINELLPPLETQEGQIASALTKVFLGGSKFGLTGAFATFGPMIITAVIAFAIGKIFDAIFDKDPQAFATLSFDPLEQEWSITDVFSDDGGNVQLARQLADNVDEKLEEIVELLQSTDHSYEDGFSIRIGHYEESLRNGDGNNYANDQPDVILASIIDALLHMSVSDGNLKAVRALDLDGLAEATADMTAKEAYSFVYTRLKIARDFQIYLENTAYINNIILTAPESALAKSWLATILAASEAGLNEGYTFAGADGDNLLLASDGNDNLAGGAGNDEIRAYDGDDIVDGGADDDLLSGGVGADTIIGGTGIDRVTFDNAGEGVEMSLLSGTGSVGDAQGDTYDGIEDITGTFFSDVLEGDGGANDIDAGNGSDTVFGRGGADTIRGGEGNDTIEGNGGNDTIYGDEGEDEIFGQVGDDSLFGGADADVLWGASGNDTLDGGGGDDLLYGDLAEDVSIAGDDVISGGAGDDMMHGGEGADSFDGGEGTDTVNYIHSTSGVYASLSEGLGRVNGLVETYASVENVVGSIFNDRIAGDGGANVFEGLTGDDIFYGSGGADTYIYSFGDGNDLISDDSTDGAIDKLVFTDINVDDVEFASTSGEDLVISFGDGTTMRILDQFRLGDRYAIETIEFADDTFNLQDIRNKSTADQKASGRVIGTDETDLYVHRLGDGSYQITDYDPSGRLDRLIFADVEKDDVRFYSENDDDLIIILPNGETVAFDQHFASHSQRQLEEIRFSNGESLNFEEISRKAVADSKEFGLVRGSDFADTYLHRQGDGSYRIADYDTSGRNDRLILQDVTADQVTFTRGESDELEIRFANGEIITIDEQFDSSGNHTIEEIRFSDNTFMNLSEMAAKAADDAKGSGTVVGTVFSDTYIHSLGDGSYQISDYDTAGRIDRLTLDDVNAEDVTFRSTGGEDLIITFSNGEMLQIVDQFTENSNYGVEVIEFADGTQLGPSEIRAKSAEDSKDYGYVRGTDFADSYTHTTGDGSYRINDYDNDSRPDSLTFTDIARASATLFRLENDLYIVLDTGERIVVEQHFESNYQIESFVFSDGVIITGGGVTAELTDVSTFPEFVTGTTEDETYTYTLGDGDLVITDYYRFKGNDELVFTGVNAADVKVSRAGQDLLLIMPDDSVITLRLQLNENEQDGIETIVWDDETTWTRADMRNQMVADAKEDGVVTGTQLDEAYVHTTGDGSYSIDDYDRFIGNDSLTFTDILPEDVSLARVGFDLLIAIDGGEQVVIRNQFFDNLQYSIETIVFANDGDPITWNTGDIRDRVVEDMKASGTVVGTQEDEDYVHTSGDGSYTIKDYDRFIGNDTLTFTDLNPEDVTVSRAGDDVILTLSTGEIIVIERALQEDRQYQIEQIIFADDTTWTGADLRNQMVEDTKSTGITLGTQLDENYVHTLGDGSYRISDYDRFIGTDTLEFTDVDRDDVVFGRAGPDLTLTLPNGEMITLVRQLDENNQYGLEEVIFASGASLDRGGLRDAMVAQMKALGIVVGTQNDERYVHAAGDGSYIIEDYDRFIGNDSLEFTDLFSTDAVFGSAGDDLLIRLSSGETITVLNYLTEDRQNALESIQFADNVSYNNAQVRNRIVQDQKAEGIVFGSENDETFTHTMGDGSYVISEYDRFLGNDVLYFTDAEKSDLTLSRFGNDLIVTLSNGDVITILGQLDEDERKSIDQFQFSDFSSWSREQIRNELMSDMKATGAVVGTELNERYLHFSGDGSYTISDYDRFQGEDRLVFMDVEADDMLVSRNGNDLILNLTNGESITILGQLNSDGRRTIENFEFSDFSSATAAEMAARLTEDMQEAGLVVGTTANDVYTHALGDGTYDIDEMGGRSTDKLVLSDQLPEDVSLTRIDDNMVLTLSNGEILTVVNQFGSDYDSAVETVEFSDGSVWTHQIMRNLAVDSQKASGLVTTTIWSEVISHAAGDGSYTITGPDNVGNSSDELHLTDLNQASITIVRVDLDLQIVLPNAEIITLDGYFDPEMQWQLERIRFADDSVVSNILGIAPTSDGIVSGTFEADVIDASYFDVDLDTITDNGQTIQGGGGADQIYDGDGDDIVEGGAGSDRFYAGAGADAYDGGEGSQDTVYYSLATSSVSVDASDLDDNNGIAMGDTFVDVERIFGSDFGDSLTTGGSIVYVYGRSGNDLLTDDEGLDTLRGGDGADTFRFVAEDGETDIVLDFEVGTDVLDFSRWGVETFEQLGFADSGDGGTLVSFGAEAVLLEGVDLTSAGDLTSADIIFAAVQDDPDDPVQGGETITGTEGRDVIDATYEDADGNMINDDGQTILGLKGADKIFDGAGDDVVRGGRGRDVFQAGEGADAYYGGKNNRDEISYTSSTEAVMIFGDNSGINSGIGMGDTLDGVEVLTGSKYSDMLFAGGDVVYLSGRNGNDILYDSAASNFLKGGNNSDTFVFGVDGKTERVLDFKLADDVMDISAWGATSIDDLTFKELQSDGQPAGRLVIRYGGERLEIDGYAEADFGGFTDDHFIFA